MSEPSPVVRPAPDPERDARVARRRAADAARAGRALDALLADERCDGLRCTCCSQLHDLRWMLRPSTCVACPEGCSSCTRDRSDCECYEHQDNYSE